MHTAIDCSNMSRKFDDLRLVRENTKAARTWVNLLNILTLRKNYGSSSCSASDKIYRNFRLSYTEVIANSEVSFLEVKELTQ